MVDCKECDYSKYGGYSHIAEAKEYCLKHGKELVVNDDRTIPCDACNGEDFVEEPW